MWHGLWPLVLHTLRRLAMRNICGILGHLLAMPASEPDPVPLCFAILFACKLRPQSSMHPLDDYLEVIIIYFFIPI